MGKVGDDAGSEGRARPTGVCTFCGCEGEIGRQLVTYSFGPKDWRLLCWQGAGKDCMVKAWEAFKSEASTV